MVMSCRKTRLDGDRAIEIGERAIILTLLVPYQAAVVINGRVGETRANGLIEISERAVELARSAPQDAAIVIDKCISRLDVESLIVIVERTRGITQFVPNIATVDQHGGAARADRQGFVAFGKGT